MILLKLKALICSPRGNFPIGSTYQCEEFEAKQLLDGGYAELLGVSKKVKEKKEVESTIIEEVETSNSSEEIETTDLEVGEIENTSTAKKKKKGRPVESE